MSIMDSPLVICSNGRTNDIVIMEFRNNLVVDLDIAKKIVDYRLQFAQNKNHFLVIDFSNVKQVNPEAKQFMKNPDGGLKNILGAAFIASNPVSTLIANVFLKIPKNFPTRFFSSKEEAFDWIDNCRKQLIKE
jgi:hypothetical protein